MERKRIPIEAQDYDKVAHFEASVVHWSCEHTRLAAKTMDALTTVRDLTAAKNQIIEGLCKGSSVDSSRVAQCRLVRETDGKSYMELVLHEAPAPETAPAAAPPDAPAPAEAAAPAS